MAIEKFVLLHLSAHWGDLIEQKKICHIHFNSVRFLFLMQSVAKRHAIS